MRAILWMCCMVWVAAASGQTLSGKSNSLVLDFSEGAPRRNRALIMGVSKYQFESPTFKSLELPARDAKALADVLVNEYKFEASDVTVLLDPSRQQILDAMDKLSQDTHDHDNLLVFYAGHGFWDKQRELGYWLPSDARPDSRSNWISNSDIKDNLSITSIRARHTLLITDACFGGSIFKSRGQTGDIFMQISEMYRYTSRKAMTSGNLSTVPDKSVFIEELLGQLRTNQDEYLPALTLFTRLYEPVMNQSTSTPVYGVINGAGDEGGDFIFERRKK